MKRLLGTGILLLILGALGNAASARAADAGDSWGGLYVGLAPGAKLSDSEWRAKQVNGGTAAVDSTSPRTYSISAFRIGGYAGFNWQRGNWVFGPELDFAWSDQTDTENLFPGCGAGCGGFTPTPGPNDTTSVRMKWDGGVRGRLGYLVEPTLLLFGTGGLAIQDIESKGTCSSPTLNSQYCFGPQPISPITNDQVFFGVSVGGGVETRLYDHWLLRGEYRFAYFPGMDDTMAFPPGGGGGDNTYRYSLSAMTHILTLGIAYKF
jgi:outer membrane immunogenic protein